MEIFFDTETTGVPVNYNAPMSDVKNWPRLVQIGWIVFSDGEKVSEKEYIIKPDGFEIPEIASRVHGITTEKAIESGNEIREVLEDFFSTLSTCDTIVGHNISFDINIVGAEYWRLYQKSPFTDQKVFCTMKAGTDICKIPGKYGYKWPKLHELYFAIFGEEMGAAHTALQDISNTAKCYFAMVEKDAIKLPGTTP